MLNRRGLITTALAAGVATQACAAPRKVAAAGAVVDIPNAAALTAMLNAGVGASGGKTYRLAANTDFGALDCNGKDFSRNPITIVGQTGTKFSGMGFTNSKGMTWRAFNIYGVIYDFAGLSVTGSDLLTFDKVTLINAAAVEGTPVSHIGIYVRNNLAATSIQFIGHRDNAVLDLWGWGNPINLQSSSNVTVSGMTLSNSGVDHLLLYGLNSSVIDGVIPGTCYSPGDPDGHPDFIQLGVSRDTGKGCNGLLIKNCGNQRHPAPSAGCQGYFIESGANITIQDCWGYYVYGNGFSVSASANITVDDLYLQPISGVKDSYATITTRGATSAVTVKNSFAGLIQAIPAEGPYPGYSESGNKAIGDVAAGDYAALDAWLATRPNVRRRFAYAYP